MSARGSFFKATNIEGFDFYTGRTIDYAGALGGVVRAPSPESSHGYSCCSDGVLHAADVPTMTLIGGRWPCRLFEVTGNPVAQEGHKFGFRQLFVVREVVPAHLALGPQGEQVAALIERASRLKRGEVDDLRAARDAARDAAWGAARDAAWGAAWGAARRAARDAARDAAWGAAWGAARGAAWGAAGGAAGLAVRDLIGQYGFTQAHYDLLVGPWARVIGPVHPDDTVPA